MPRTLHDEIELDTITEIIDLMAGHVLTADQSDYLENIPSHLVSHMKTHAPIHPGQVLREDFMLPKKFNHLTP
jgi:hypothetical protein